MTPDINHLAEMLSITLKGRGTELGFESSCVFVAAQPKSGGNDVVLVFADGELVTDPDRVERLAQRLFLSASGDAQNHLMRAKAARTPKG